MSKTLKTISATLATVLLIGGGATATSAQTDMDANGDGVYSIEEMQAVFPDLTEETFTTIDANADGVVDADELKAAQDAGMLPANG